MSETRTITVEVTQEDIDHGEPEHPENCPISLASCRAAGSERASVDYEGIEFDNGDKVKIPEEVNHWIREFDNRETVFPITFTLEI